jgi:nitrate reductase gamma subunit
MQDKDPKVIEESKRNFKIVFGTIAGIVLLFSLANLTLKRK